MADVARLAYQPRRHGRRRTYGAVSLLTATAVLTTLASTPSYAHDENITTRTEGGVEYATWRETTDAAGQPGIRLASLSGRKVERSCRATARHEYSFLSDTTAAQRDRVRAAMDAAYSRRMIRGEPIVWVKDKNYGMVYAAGYVTPDSIAKVGSCPDVLNTGNFSRVHLSSRRATQEEVDFYAGYGIAGASFAVAAVIGTIAGVAAPSAGAAVLAGAVLGCAAGAVAQALIGYYAGRAAGPTAKRAAYACAIDATVGAAGAASGAWLKGSSRAAGVVRHKIRDLFFSAKRYFDLDDVNAAVEVVGQGLSEGARASRLAHRANVS